MVISTSHYFYTHQMMEKIDNVDNVKYYSR